MSDAFWETMRQFDEEKFDLTRRNTLAASAMLQLASESRKAVGESWELIRKIEEILARDDFQAKPSTDR